MPFPRKYAVQDPGTGWRERLAKARADFTNRNLDHIQEDIENKVYAMALDGAGLHTIADYFGVCRTEFTTVYREVWLAGRAELQAIIAADTVEYGLKSQIPVAKIWLGKSMGGLGEGKSVDVENNSDDSGEVNLNIRVIRREDAEAKS